MSTTNDARVIHEALSNNSDSSLLDLISRKNAKERNSISDEYVFQYGNTLFYDLDKTFKPNKSVNRGLKALFQEQSFFESWLLRDAVQGAGTKEWYLNNILTTMTNEEKLSLINAYTVKFNRSIIADVKSDTSGDYKNFLVACFAKRSSPDMTSSNISHEAKALYKAGEKHFGTDEQKFIDLLCKKDFLEAQAIMKTYIEDTKSKKKNFLETIDAEFSGNCKEAMRSSALYIIDREQWYACKIREIVCQKGKRKKKALIWLVLVKNEAAVGQNKLHWKKVIECYREKYQQDFVSDLKVVFENANGNNTWMMELLVAFLNK